MKTQITKQDVEYDTMFVKNIYIKYLSQYVYRYAKES